MSSGDDIQAGRVTTAESTTDLVGAVPSERDVDFNGNVILRVGPQRGDLRPNHTLDGIHGLATNGTVPSPGGTGVVGFGGPNQGTGVLGLGGASGGGSGGTGSGGTGIHGIGGDGISFGFGGPINPGTGVLGIGGKPDPYANPPMPGGVGVWGVSNGPADAIIGICDVNDRSGVYGFNSTARGSAFGVFGRCNAAEAAGVGADSQSGVGVRAHSAGNDAVVGLSDGTFRSGVYGFNSRVDSDAFGVFGRCNGLLGVGVVGENAVGDGVVGRCLGVGRGVYGQTKTGVGVMGLSWTTNGLAGFFQGRVAVVGSFVVYGSKAAAVPFHDGSHRQLYCVESPESWFEDFGEAKLVDGRAVVDLEPGYASVVNTDQYHVFITPLGDCNGLHVSRRDARGFEVTENNGGKSNVAFSYRVIAHRKDLNVTRFEHIALPEAATSVNQTQGVK